MSKRVSRRDNYEIQNQIGNDKEITKASDKERDRNTLKYSGDVRDRNNKPTLKRDKSHKAEKPDDQKENAEADVAEMMGFGGFGSTKGKKVQAEVGGVSTSKKGNFRQYMNRNQGFNRPLSPERKKK